MYLTHTENNRGRICLTVSNPLELLIDVNLPQAGVVNIYMCQDVFHETDR